MDSNAFPPLGNWNRPAAAAAAASSSDSSSNASNNNNNNNNSRNTPRKSAWGVIEKVDAVSIAATLNPSKNKDSSSSSSAAAAAAATSAVSSNQTNVQDDKNWTVAMSKGKLRQVKQQQQIQQQEREQQQRMQVRQQQQQHEQSMTVAKLWSERFPAFSQQQQRQPTPLSAFAAAGSNNNNRGSSTNGHGVSAIRFAPWASVTNNNGLSYAAALSTAPQFSSYAATAKHSKKSRKKGIGSDDDNDETDPQLSKLLSKPKTASLSDIIMMKMKRKQPKARLEPVRPVTLAEKVGAGVWFPPALKEIKKLSKKEIKQKAKQKKQVQKKKKKQLHGIATMGPSGKKIVQMRKVRQTPKKKRLSSLKKIIIKDRLARKEARLAKYQERLKIEAEKEANEKVILEEKSEIKEETVIPMEEKPQQQPDVQTETEQVKQEMTDDKNQDGNKGGLSIFATEFVPSWMPSFASAGGSVNPEEQTKKKKKKNKKKKDEVDTIADDNTKQQTQRSYAAAAASLDYNNDADNDDEIHEDIIQNAAAAVIENKKTKNKNNNNNDNKTDLKSAIDAVGSSSVAKSEGKKQKYQLREYCQQIITPELNAEVYKLLDELHKFQLKAMQKDMKKAKIHRRYVCGLRETLRSLKTDEAKCIVIAPNVEESPSEGGLDDNISEIVETARNKHVPCVFALNRIKLGSVTGRGMRQSAVAIQSADGAHEIFRKVVELANIATLEFARLYPDKVKQFY